MRQRRQTSGRISSDWIPPPLCLNSILWSISSGPDQYSVIVILTLFLLEAEISGTAFRKNLEQPDLQSMVLLVIWVRCLLAGLLQFLFTALCLLVYIGEVQVRVRRK